MALRIVIRVVANSLRKTSEIMFLDRDLLCIIFTADVYFWEIIQEFYPLTLAHVACSLHMPQGIN